jgi:hypothetical protein
MKIIFVTTCILALLATQVLTNSRTDLHKDDHLTEEQMDALEREAKKQAKHETDERPATIPYSEFLHLLFDNERLTKSQKKLIDEQSISTIKHFYTSRDERLSRERYGALLMMMMDGSAHDEEIDEDIREEA